MIIGEIAERIQFTQRHETAAQARRINQIGSRLITTFDLSALADILAENYRAWILAVVICPCMPMPAPPLRHPG